MSLAIRQLLLSLLLFRGTPTAFAGKKNRKNDLFDRNEGDDRKDRRKKGYEVWAADQSNSAPGQSALGVKGGFIWIYDSESIDDQLNGGQDATPLPCSPNSLQGPCNILDVFPQQTLLQYRQDGSATGKALGELEGFGRIHGTLADNSGRYITANMFTPGGGYVGIMDTLTKEAVGLFRVTKFNYGDESSNRSVHMSFWSDDGSYIAIANLHGKAIERINVIRDEDDTITDLVFDKSATLGLGQSMTIAEEATVFRGANEHNKLLIGSISGSYAIADLGDLTPNGVCKENGCSSGPNGEAGGRPNNLPICPIASTAGNLYITLAGGGLLVAHISSTPMTIVGEYGMAVMYGAGCGGAQSGNQMFLNGGVSASGAGATQSMFSLFSLSDNSYPSGADVLAGTKVGPQNTPMPLRVFQDEGNTKNGGNVEGNKSSDMSGQIPGVTTRRDSHGTVIDPDGNFVYIVDRIQNVIEVFGVDTCERHTFDLVSKSGQGGRRGPSTDCYARSVLDDPMLPLDDPTGDLLDMTPDGKHIVMALRGPAPISVKHAAQGSCPGVGLVKLSRDGTGGRLVAVLRTTNTISDEVEITETTFPGGVPYSGSERSDVHGVFVVERIESK